VCRERKRAQGKGDDVKLPELPLPDIHGPSGWERTDTQVIAYGIACARAALEEAAKVCEARWEDNEYLLPEEIRAIAIDGES
jgi:hypothetical protein